MLEGFDLLDSHYILEYVTAVPAEDMAGLFLFSACSRHAPRWYATPIFEIQPPAVQISATWFWRAAPPASTSGPSRIGMIDQWSSRDSGGVSRLPLDTRVRTHDDAPVGSTGFVYVTFSTATFSAPLASFLNW